MIEEVKTCSTYPTVLISIVTWNHEKHINATIVSLLNQTHKDFRIVIFDNNSEDKTKDIIKNFSEVILIENADNIGFCEGHNYNISNFKFDYIFLVNPDIVLRENYIEKTLLVFEEHDNVGAVCGLLLQSQEENPLIDSAGMSILKSRRFVMNYNNEPLNSKALQSGFVAGLDGALPAFKLRAIKDLEINRLFFDPLFFSHKEDWDISWRLLLFGWRIYFNKESIAIHPRLFRPGKLKVRFKLDSKIKYDAFKNQLLLLIKNEDWYNYRKDFFSINFRLLKSIVYCLFFEFRSLYAFIYVIKNRRAILEQRKIIQQKRKLSPKEFRSLYIH